MQEGARDAADQAHERSAEPAELEECGYGLRPAALREFALRLLSCGTYFSWGRRKRCPRCVCCPSGKLSASAPRRLIGRRRGL